MRRRVAALVGAAFMCLGAGGKDLHVGSTPYEDEPPPIRVLVVAVADFQHLSDANDLRYTEADAELFIETITRQSGGAIRSRDVTRMLGRDARAGAVRHEVAALLGDAGPNDVLILYFSTHGVVSGGDGYLLTWDSQPEGALRSTSLPISYLQNEIQHSRARHVLLFTDACHAAMIGGPGTRSGPSNTVNSVLHSLDTSSASFFNMASSLTGEFSVEGPSHCGGHGAFTCALSQALSGEADIDQDGAVALGELAVTLPSMVFRATNGGQHPEVKGDYDPELKISLAASGVEPYSALERAEPGAIRIVSEVGGQVHLDGVPYERLAPHDELVIGNLKPGAHTVKLDGAVETVEVLPGETAPIHFARPAQGRLVVTVVEGGLVRIDGEPVEVVGANRSLEIDLEVGPHRVEVDGETKRIEIDERVPQTLRFEGAPATGTLQVQAFNRYRQPVRQEIWIDHEAVGRTPWRGSLPVGTYTVQIDGAERGVPVTIDAERLTPYRADHVDGPLVGAGLMGAGAALMSAGAVVGATTWLAARNLPLEDRSGWNEANAAAWGAVGLGAGFQITGRLWRRRAS